MDDERNGTNSARRRKEKAGLSYEAKAYLTEWLYNDNAPTKASAVAPRMTPPTAPEPPLSATRKLVAVADYGRPLAASLAREPASRAPGSPVRMRKETAAKEEKMAPLLIAKSMAPSEVALTMKEGSVGRRRNNEDKQWDARFTELVNYRSEHGDCNVPVNGDKLGTWIRTQRASYKADSLAQDRVDRLNSIGFHWTLIERRPTVPWETRFNELVKYKAKHGDCNAPQRQGQLGRWVNHQRSAYMTDSLAQDRVDQLNNIGFEWVLREVAPKVPWETRFDKLVQYKSRNSDCNVPQSQGQLGRWVSNQRTAYKANSLAQDRVDRLNGIGFDWTPLQERSKKRKAIPIAQVQSSARNENVSLFDANVESVSVAAGTSGFESNKCEGEGRAPGPALTLPVPSGNFCCNRGTESDDELDEIGALIYDHVMQRRRWSRGVPGCFSEH